MMGSYIVFILFAFLVEGVFGDAAEVKLVMEEDPVTLNTDVTKQKNDMVWWYFNDTLNDTRIALINGDANTSCLYDGVGGRFRDRLKVDYETGSLTITDIRSEHAGRYEAELYRRDSSGKTETFNVNPNQPQNKNPKCDSTRIVTKRSSLGKTIKSISLTVSASKADKNEKEPQKTPQNQNIDASSGLSSAVIGGICAGVVLLLAAAVVVVGVMIYRWWSSRNDMKKNKQGLL